MFGSAGYATLYEHVEFSIHVQYTMRHTFTVLDVSFPFFLFLKFHVYIPVAIDPFEGHKLFSFLVMIIHPNSQVVALALLIKK